MPARTARWADFVELTKPRITFMVALTTAAGYLVGVAPGRSLLGLFHTVLGTALVASAASTLNQWMERETDARMERTRNRPLPAGRLEPGVALGFGLGLSLLGTLYLALLCGPLPAGIGLLTLALYVLAYTPMKTVSSLCTIVGGVPGALPPVLGWAAARGDLSIGAWVLFAILFLWQMPHFLAIAWMYREEYERGGQPMLPVIDPGGQRTGRQIVLNCLALLPVSLLPTLIGMAGSLYFWGAIALGVLYLGAGLLVAARPSEDTARTLLRVSVGYLPLLVILMATDRVTF